MLKHSFHSQYLGFDRQIKEIKNDYSRDLRSKGKDAPIPAVVVNAEIEATWF